MSSIWPFEKKPRKVQLAALEAGLGVPGFAYFMRQRMGKTGTLLADFEMCRRAGELDTLIVVCPNSLKYAWKDAVDNEWKLDAPCHVYEAAHKDRAKYFLSSQWKKIFVINFDSLAGFLDYGYWRLFDTSRAMIAFDQSTEIKNHSAARTKAALKLSPMFKYKRVLAGKPTSNGNDELWAQLSAIDATPMSYYGFRNTYCSMITQYVRDGNGFERSFKKVIGNQNSEQLRAAMAPFVFIAGDAYLAEFEPKIYAPIRHIELSKEHAKLYKKMEKDFIIELESGSITANLVLTKYLRLQQIASGFATDSLGELKELVPMKQNPRLNEAVRIVEEEVVNKCIIFARFKPSMDWLQERLLAFNPAMIRGGMSGLDVEHNKKVFNENPSCKVLIAQIEVAKMGHTLPGTDEMPCDTLIFYENVYSLITRSEAEARPEKMGRKVPIEVIDLSTSAMDRDILTALRKKEDAAMALMGYSRKHGVLATSAHE